MPKAKVLLGYRFKAPRDIVNDTEVTKNIITAFLSDPNTKGGKADAKSLAEAWLKANKINAKTADVGRINPENHEEDTGKEQRPLNACAIDVKAKKYYYWYHDTWRSKDPDAPIMKTYDIP